MDSFPCWQIFLSWWKAMKIWNHSAAAGYLISPQHTHTHTHTSGTLTPCYQTAGSSLENRKLGFQDSIRVPFVPSCSEWYTYVQTNTRFTCEMRQSRARRKVFFRATPFTLNAHEKVKNLATETRHEKSSPVHDPSLNAHENSKEDANQLSNHMKKQRR